MMIFLTVLKVIGIILLVILGIILFILGLILFLPVRYRLDADADQRIKKYDGHVNVTWLFRFLHARAWAESGEDGNGIGYEVKVAGIKIMSSEDDVQEEDEELPDHDPVLGDMDLGEEVTVPESGGQDVAEKNVTEKYVAEQKKPETLVSQDEPDPIDDRVLSEFGSDAGDDKGFFEKVREIIDKCVSAVRNLGYTIKNICDKIKQILLDISYYKELWESAETQEVVADLLEKTAFLWRRIRPRKWNMRLHFGFSDPATTGEALGVMCAFNPLYGEHIQLQPDFDEEIIEGDFFLSGHIQLFFVVVIALKIYFNKKLKAVISRFKRGRRKDDHSCNNRKKAA